MTRKLLIQLWIQFHILKTFGINAGWTEGINYPVAYWFTPLDLLFTAIFLTLGFFVGGLIYKKVMKR